MIARWRRLRPGPPAPGRLRRWAFVAGLCACACGAGPAPAATLSGALVLVERGRPTNDLAGAMVYFTPETGATAPPAPIAAEIVMRDRRFSPRAIAVPVGSTVRFGNADPIRHNVFSVSPGNRFDLGLYGEGPGRAQRFDRPGLARIFCNVHRTMSAFVLVLDTPFHATPDAAGHFTLSGLPEGPGTLHVWHPRAEAWSRPLKLPFTDALVVTLEATLPVVPPHLDKHGRPYREPADDERYR